MSEWRKVCVDEIAEKIAIGPFGSRMKSDTYTEIGVPVIRGTNLTGGRNFSGEWVYISEEDADQLASCNVTAGDLVFPHRGAIGEVGIVPGDRDRYLLSSSLMKLKCDPKKAHSLYLFYFFKSHEGRHQLLKNASQVGTPGIGQPLSSLKSIELELPPLSNQRAIAHILGTLDDKIELNRRINETLEAIARALFKSWFVDFDPVRAKMSGEPPESICQRLGLTPDLLALFPDRLVDSELGEIPEGWEVGKLGKVLCQRVERCVASEETAARPYVPIDCISPRSIFLAESKPGIEAQSSLTKFYKGDLLFGAMRPYFHKVCIAPFDGTTRTTAFVLYPKLEHDIAFGTMLLHHPDTIDFATRHSTGSTIPYAVWADSLENKPVILPPPDVRRAFNDVVRPLLTRIPKAYFQSRTLANTRDALIPKLLTGEVRVPSAEITLEAIA